MSEELHGDDFARGARHDFAVNVSADAHPPWLTAAIADGVARLGSYPDDTAATAATARRHGREPDEVLLLNGAVQGFSLLAHGLSPRRPLVVHPAFSEPERALRDAGLAPERLVLERPFELDPQAVPDDADLVVVGNPTNPTGVLHPRERLSALCRPGRTTVIDEAFIDYVPGEPETLAGDRELPGLVVIRSLTKTLGVPGVRAGYLLGGAPLVQRLRDAAPKWSVNAVALAVIEAAAARRDSIDSQAKLTVARREALARALAATPGVFVHPGSANFLLLEFDDAVAVHARLLAAHGIATRPCWGFPGLDQRHLRVAVRGEPLDSKLIAAIRASVSAAPRASDRSRAPAQPRR
ncbi:MAG TPA: Rv2231c family pyridoxal phosphate-dependent protein CobC [Solirubrobacteraceae bacterium]|jgi:histidinol-phosphate aminotransferase